MKFFKNKLIRNLILVFICLPIIFNLIMAILVEVMNVHGLVVVSDYTYIEYYVYSFFYSTGFWVFISIFIIKIATTIFFVKRMLKNFMLSLFNIILFTVNFIIDLSLSILFLGENTLPYEIHETYVYRQPSFFMHLDTFRLVHTIFLIFILTIYVSIALLIVFDFIDNRTKKLKEKHKASSNDYNFCFDCRSRVSKTSTFCEFCGKRLVLECRECGHCLEEDHYFCGVCGTKQSETGNKLYRNSTARVLGILSLWLVSMSLLNFIMIFIFYMDTGALIFIGLSLTGLPLAIMGLIFERTRSRLGDRDRLAYYLNLISVCIVSFEILALFLLALING